jgi:hypothetical protein
MDYNNQFQDNNNNTPNRFNEPREGGGGVKSILIGILSALVVLGLVGGGIWLYNSGKGTGSSSSSSSTALTTNSGSSKSAVVVVSSTQSNITSSIASSISSLVSSTSIGSNITLLTFNDSKLPGFSFVYDSTLWQKPIVAPFGAQSGPGIGGQEITIARLNDIQATLRIQKFTNTQNVGGPLRECYSDNQNLDIGGGWYRLQVLNQTDGPGLREFTDFAPTNAGVSTVGENNCANRAFYNGFGKNAGNFPTYNAKLTFIGDNKAIADDIIKSIKY